MTKASAEAVKVGPIRVAQHIRDGAPSGRWLIDLPPHVAPGGKRHRLFKESKTAAVVVARRLLREFQLKGVVQGYGPRLSGVTFAEVGKLWLQEQLDRVATGKKREGSAESDGWWLKPLLAALGGTDVAKIGKAEVVAYQKARRDAKRAPRTINHEVRLLLRILGWAMKASLVDRLPDVEHIPVPKKRVALPSVAEVTRILGHLQPRVALLVRFLAETGARKSEAFNLEWTDLDQAASAVMFRRKANWTPKTEASDRDVPIGKALMDALFASRDAALEKARKKALEAGGDPDAVKLPAWVFPGRGGKRMTDFDKALATAIKAADVTRDGKPMHVTPHMLRKFHATALKMRGVPDEILQPRLDHTPGSRMTSTVYVIPQDEDMQTAVLDLNDPAPGRVAASRR